MRHILLIDDEEGIRIVVPKWHSVLEPTFRGQCTIDTAKNLADGRAMLASKQYDALILDLGMAPEGQKGVIQWMKSEVSSLPPVIVLTGDEDIEVRMECMSGGAAQFFTKHDAEKFPNLFFKIIWNEWVKRYGAQTT